MSWLPDALQNGFGRGVSFALAVIFSMVILVGPRWIATSPEQLDHGLLSLLMGFMCLLFVHGVGFQFNSRLLQWLISPLTLWPTSVTLFVLLVTGVR